MLTVGDKFPAFNLKGVVSNDINTAFKDFSDKAETGKWKIVFFWPKDFTFVCPTEIVEFGKHTQDFADRDAVVLGGSTDNEYSHLAWRNAHPDLADLPTPLVHINPTLANELGIIHKEGGVALRVTFVVDPNGVVRSVSAYDLSVGRNVGEVLRTLDALQSDELCPCNWQKGEETIKVA